MLSKQPTADARATGLGALRPPLGHGGYCYGRQHDTAQDAYGGDECEEDDIGHGMDSCWCCVVQRPWSVGRRTMQMKPGG